MNRINRVLLKSQARQLISKKVFKLFLISFVVSLLVGQGMSVSANFNNISDIKNEFTNDYSMNGFDEFFGEGSNPIEDFDFNENTLTAVPKTDAAQRENIGISKAFLAMPILLSFAAISGIVSLVLSPLSVTLSGIYVSFVKRNANADFDLGHEFTSLFKNTFNKNYLNKLVLNLLSGLLLILLLLLFIVPGVVFSYSIYFANQIMIDYPNLKPSEAMKLSRKIVRGNRTELFTYNITFIPWFFLSMVTLGLANIYVMPYKSTCDALYYENFRLRALAEGRVTEDDFLSEQERIMKYNGFNADASPYQANDYTAAYGAQNHPYQSTAPNNGLYFVPDFSPIEQYNAYANPAAGAYYYQQQGGEYYYAPQSRQSSSGAETRHAPFSQAEQRTADTNQSSEVCEDNSNSVSDKGSCYPTENSNNENEMP